jgi:hypothetical protein
VRHPVQEKPKIYKWSWKLGTISWINSNAWSRPQTDLQNAYTERCSRSGGKFPAWTQRVELHSSSNNFAWKYYRLRNFTASKITSVLPRITRGVLFQIRRLRTSSFGLLADDNAISDQYQIFTWNLEKSGWFVTKLWIKNQKFPPKSYNSKKEPNVTVLRRFLRSHGANQIEIT